MQPWEKLDSWFTPANRFFNVNHYGQPQTLDETNWQVDLGGSFARPQSLTIADIKTHKRHEVDFTLECSGNGGFPFFISAVGNARWAGAQLAPILEEAGLSDKTGEIVFYGIDSGQVAIRDNVGILDAGQTGTAETGPDGTLNLKITERFARSMSLGDALGRDNLLCYEMNDAPLPPEHGFPLRLLAPGWYGVANVKWLTRIEAIDHRYAGRFMARDYVTIREEQRGGETVWTFTTVGRTRLKSAPSRVTRQSNGHHTIFGAAWGAPIAVVQVQIDGGPWLPAKLESPSPSPGSTDDYLTQLENVFGSPGADRRSGRGYSWKLWRFNWGRPVSGEHTVRSRAFDTSGNIQPAPGDPFLAAKRTYWESNGQITRSVQIR